MPDSPYSAALRDYCTAVHFRDADAVARAAVRLDAICGFERVFPKPDAASETATVLRDLLIAVAYSNTWLPLTDTFQRACAALEYRSEPGRGLFDQAGNRIPNPFEGE